MRASLDTGHSLPKPDGILFNGRGPEETFFAFEPGEFVFFLLLIYYIVCIYL